MIATWAINNNLRLSNPVLSNELILAGRVSRAKNNGSEAAQNSRLLLPANLTEEDFCLRQHRLHSLI